MFPDGFAYTVSYELSAGAGENMGDKTGSFRDRKQRKEKKNSRKKRMLLVFCILALVFGCTRFLTTDLYSAIKYQTCYVMLKNLSPLLMKEESAIPGQTTKEYDTKTESEIAYEVILATEVAEENKEAVAEQVKQENKKEQAKKTAVPLEKLQDFDYLIQNYYTVDKMTTITGKQLKADELLSIDCGIKKNAADPQILIYHTHSQESYKDSRKGEPADTVVGVGDYLTALLTEQYGYSVIHHKGAYDLEDRNNAYTNVASVIEQILADHPTIEVVIDLHRDGVPEDTRLVTELNGEPVAKIMFFNGLSYSTEVGEIEYLYNPYIKENLAFSLQLQLALAEAYPGLCRKIYLKGYRYNLHFRPRSLLVEVGAQTNTVEEAMNAMVPFAEILDGILTGE